MRTQISQITTLLLGSFRATSNQEGDFVILLKLKNSRFDFFHTSKGLALKKFELVFIGGLNQLNKDASVYSAVQ